MYIIPATNLFERASNYLLSQRANIAPFVKKIFETYASANAQIARFAQSNLIAKRSVALIAGGVVLGAVAITTVWRKYTALKTQIGIDDFLKPAVSRLAKEQNIRLVFENSRLKSDLEGLNGIVARLTQEKQGVAALIPTIDSIRENLMRAREELQRVKAESEDKSRHIDYLQDQLTSSTEVMDAASNLGLKNSLLASKRQIVTLNNQCRQFRRNIRRYGNHLAKHVEVARIFGDIIIKNLPHLTDLVFHTNDNPFSPDTQRELDQLSTSFGKEKGRAAIMSSLLERTPGGDGVARSSVQDKK